MAAIHNCRNTLQCMLPWYASVPLFSRWQNGKKFCCCEYDNVKPTEDIWIAKHPGNMYLGGADTMHCIKCKASESQAHWQRQRLPMHCRFFPCSGTLFRCETRRASGNWYCAWELTVSRLLWWGQDRLLFVDALFSDGISSLHLIGESKSCVISGQTYCIPAYGTPSILYYVVEDNTFFSEGPICFRVMLHDPVTYPEPSKFCPERWFAFEVPAFSGMCLSLGGMRAGALRGTRKLVVCYGERAGCGSCLLLSRT